MPRSGKVVSWRETAFWEVGGFRPYYGLFGNNLPGGVARFVVEIGVSKVRTKAHGSMRAKLNRLAVAFPACYGGVSEDPSIRRVPTPCRRTILPIGPQVLESTAPKLSDLTTHNYYEVKRSYERGNGMLGVYLHNIKDWAGNTDTPGSNTFGELGTDAAGRTVYFWQKYLTYDWVTGKGYDNFGDWVEAAAEQAGR